MKENTKSMLALDSIEEDIMNDYIDLLLRENKKYNLTRITDPDTIREKLFLDSILPVRELWGDALSGKWIDVGSGAGFPGMPIALWSSNVTMTVLDSVGKKCAFLKLVVEHFNMQNVTIVKERAEVAGSAPHYRERFDVCLSRALAKLPVALESTAPFVRPDGNVLLWLGKEDAKRLHSSTHALKGFLLNT